VIETAMKNHELKIDQRKYDRAPAQFTIQYSCGGRFYTEYLIDLSIGGICIDALNPVEPKTRLIITIPSKPVIKIGGIVKWCRKDGHRYKIGIEFDDLTREQESGIRKVISSLFWEVSQQDTWI
jgi:hypothetical protein